MKEMVEVPVKFLDMPKNLVDRGKVVLTMQGSIKYLVSEMMKALTADIAKNTLEVGALWKEVQDEVKKQGIKIAEDEKLYFDYVIDKYYIAKRKVVGE